MSASSMSDEFDSLDATEKAAVEAATTMRTGRDG
jgi:hypothetical protein